MTNRRVIVSILIAWLGTLCAGGFARDAMALSVSYCNGTGKGFVTCPGGGPTVTIGTTGGLTYPEIVPIFWGSQWSTGSGRAQTIGTLQSIINSPYLSALSQYGFNGSGGNGIVAARMVPVAPIYTHTAIPATATSNDLKAAINYLVGQGLVPAPLSYDNMLYIVFFPSNTTNGLDWNAPGSCDSTCGSLGNNNGYHMAAVGQGDQSGLSHEIAESIAGNVGLSGCTSTVGASTNQIADICECDAAQELQMQGALKLGSYWSSQDQRCVIPEAYPGILTFDPNNTNNGSGGWASITTFVLFDPNNTNNGSGGWASITTFGVRQAYAGAGLVVATKTDDNVYLYNKSAGTWSQIGGPGSMFSLFVDGLTPSILGLTPTANQVFELSPGFGSWQPLGDPPNLITAVYGGTSPVVTNEAGNTYYYANGSWHANFSGTLPAFDQVVNSGGNVVGLALDHQSVWRQAALGSSWTQINPAASAVFGGPSTTLIAATGGLGDDWMTYPPPSVHQAGPGNTFAVGPGMLWALQPDRAAVFQSNNVAISNPSWTKIGAALGRFVGADHGGVNNGPLLYAVGCNNNNNGECVSY